MANRRVLKPKKRAAPINIADVSAKMFCQGLGDCFLITLPQTGGRPYSILIDFGVAMGTSRAESIMVQVVKKVGDLTGGIVDLLVVTHEHWDHVSGFIQAAAELGKGNISFKHLWLAWTENPEDKLAQELQDSYGKAKLAVARARQMAAGLAADPSSAEQLAALDGVLAFYGPGAAAGADKGKGSLSDALTTARVLVGADKDEKKLDYLRPGRQLPLPGEKITGLAAGVKAYVLGPPHVREKMTKIEPGKAHPETYEMQKQLSPNLSANWAWMAAAMKAEIKGADLSGDPQDSANFDRSQPFDENLRFPLENVKKDPFFLEHYFADTEENDGRRIDGDWLWSGAQKLALQLESYTNNTSLVLAFELPNSKKVLLFTGDAQVGNWLSWHDQDYGIENGKKITAASLLSRTVLYKVGHHGSHNATLRQKGLELMIHPDLVAMLPVEAEAVKRLRYGEMPLKSLMEALMERTDGRILRLDEEWKNAKAPGIWAPRLLRATANAETITVGKEGNAERPLYMEYVIEDA
jgi:hypothetical protein